MTHRTTSQARDVWAIIYRTFRLTGKSPALNVRFPDAQGYAGQRFTWESTPRGPGWARRLATLELLDARRYRLAGKRRAALLALRQAHAYATTNAVWTVIP
jgi:hypothetical protein